MSRVFRDQIWRGKVSAAIKTRSDKFPLEWGLRIARACSLGPGLSHCWPRVFSHWRHRYRWTDRGAMLEADNIASPSPPTFSPGKKRTTAEKTLYCFEPVTINSTQNQLMLALKFSEIKKLLKKTFRRQIIQSQITPKN